MFRDPDNWVDVATFAWAIIANVDEGSWDQQTEEWKAAAREFRDDLFAANDSEGFFPKLEEFYVH